MKKRDTLMALLALGAAPFATRAQQPGKVWRIGYLGQESGPNNSAETFACCSIQRLTEPI